MDVEIRPTRPEDLDACGRVCYRAFSAIAKRHGFPPPFASEKDARLRFGPAMSDGLTYGVVADRGGRIVGSAFIHDRRPVAGIGPVTVDPSAQDAGLGRRMMSALLEWANEREFPSIRLVQDAYHARSMALYMSLGFEAREPLSCLKGMPIEGRIPGYRVRPATAEDVPACEDLGRAGQGFARTFEVERAIERDVAMVVQRGGRITGYASEVSFWGHANAETNQDIQALIAAAPFFGGPGFLVSTRNSEVIRWCLARTLRLVHPMTLMTIGWYQEPTAPYLASVLF